MDITDKLKKFNEEYENKPEVLFIKNKKEGKKWQMSILIN